MVLGETPNSEENQDDFLSDAELLDWFEVTNDPKMWEVPKLERVDFAKDSQEFATKRAEFVADRIGYWEGKIDFAINDFYEHLGLVIAVKSPEIKRRAATLLAHAELGIKLVFNRYSPESNQDYSELKFATAMEYDNNPDHIFSYTHSPRSYWGSMITVQLQWLLDVAEAPEQWYEALKARGGYIGPFNLDTIEDLFLMEAIEEATHELFITFSKDISERKIEPDQLGEFYYAEDFEYQTLKVKYFFVKKYLPQYEERYREHLAKMRDYRKQQGWSTPH